MQVYFNGYTVEKVVKGRSSYEKMVVSYSYQGQSKTKNIMSFANPSVFAAIKGFAEGDQLDVTLTKNDAGYDEWASVARAAGVVPGSTVQGTGEPSKAPAARSTYETAEERAKKQVYIIKQSCLAQAIAFTGQGTSDDVGSMLAVAQEFVDWVLDSSLEEAHDAS